MSNPGFAFTILAFLLVLGPLIFIHELGHYFAGRWFGVKAETFSIGFGREIFGWTDKRGTRWKVGWMPLGGYVKFKGDMNPASQPSPEWLAMPPAEREETFQAKKLWQRFIIVAAGPFTNFLFAILAFMAIFATIGYPSSPAVVGSVLSDSPAAEAGLRPGDRIVSVNGTEVRTFADLQSRVALRPEQRLVMEVARGGEEREIEIVPEAAVVSDRFGNEARVGRIGVGGAVELSRLPVTQLPGAAIETTVDTVETMIVALGQVITGQRSMEELGGPLRIAEYSGQQASLGILPFLWFMTVISINLGFINLLPIPLLDGGHLLFYLVEGVRRKPLRPEVQEWAFRTGLAMLLGLMIFVTLNDLASFGVFSGLPG